MAMNIADLIEEGKRLEKAYDSAVKRELDSEAHALWDQRCAFWDEHGPRLLAVAEAAVAYRKAVDYAWPILTEGPGGTMPEVEAETVWNEAEAAFDAAASGEARG